MAQEHQQQNSGDVVTQNMQCKRGQPRKDGIPGSEAYKRTQRCKVDVEAHGGDPFVGQIVSGVLDGKFDAGYMLTVRVGERGSILHGLVFEPGLSVPISSANDIAPNVRMFKRDEVSLPSSAWQLSCFSPVRSRKDGAVRHHPRSEYPVSKVICSDIVAEGLNPNAQLRSLVDIRIQKNDSNLGPGNLKLDLLSTSGGDNVLKDGNQKIQSSIVSTECSTDIHLPDVIGNCSIVTPNSCKIAGFQDVVGDGKLITQLSQTMSESNQAATSDGTHGFNSDIKTANLQEVNDVNQITGTPQGISQAKRRADTSDMGPKLSDDNKIVHPYEIVSDLKPVTEFSPTKVSKSEQLSESIDSEHTFMKGASDDFKKALPPATIQGSEHVTVGVDDLGETPHTTESSVGESTCLHPIKLALADGTAEVAQGTDTSVGLESQVHPEPVVAGSNQSAELAGEPPKVDTSAPRVIPELQGDLATPGGESTMVSYGATTEVTNCGPQVSEIDVTNGGS